MIKQKIEHSLQLISDAVQKYPRIAVFSSFGKDSIVTLHLCQRIMPDIQVISVMTPYKFNQTRHYKDYIAHKWNLNLKTYEAPKLGNDLYETDVEECCDYYKVEPTKQAIRDFDLQAWICGLRGTEGHTRKFLDETEEKQGLVKVNPILKWTEAEIWLYHAMCGIPPHPLYEQGYRSLGCEPCSKPNTTSERGGRWAGTEKCGAECGIHTRSLK